MAIPRGQIPDNVLKKNTVEGYLKFLADEIRRTNAHWDHFAKEASTAYAKAYEENGTVLQGVKVAQQAHKAADDALMSFALSLFTVGIAGAVAGGLVAFRNTDNSRGIRAAETAARDVVKQVIRGAASAPTDAAIQALSPDKVARNDVFAPGDVDPTVYLAQMLAAISYNNGLLEDILHEVNYNQQADAVIVPDGNSTNQVFLNRSGDGQITKNSAKLLAEVITGTSYFQQMPPMSVNSSALKPKASLALWIGWALNRDPDYWSDGNQESDHHIIAGPGGGGGSISAPSKATEEQLDWEPVRRALLLLRVPLGPITATLRTHVWTGDQTQTGLYMWGFMSWAASPAALNLLLDDTVRTEDTVAVQRVYGRMARRILTPKNQKHPRWIELPEPIVTPL
jgi:hypothetical protein